MVEPQSNEGGTHGGSEEAYNIPQLAKHKIISKLQNNILHNC